MSRQSRLPRRVLVPVAACCAFAAGGLFGVGCSGNPRPPHVILVTLDTTRLDRIGCYGAERVHTPTLDSLAARGARFTQITTPVPLTAPAHSSILTGLNPPRHGVRDNGSFVLEASVPVLQEHFREAGYETAAFLSAFVLERQFGLDRGFDTYDDAFYNERQGARTVAATVRWLRERAAREPDDARPLFLWVHLFDPHMPWEAPEPYASLEVATDYDREIAAMDGAIRTLLDEMRSHGLLEDAVLLLAGDHGEGLGDHGEDEHGLFLYDETLRVPFLFVAPGVSPGTVVDSPGSLIDIAPTLLDAAGLAPMDAVEGSSLLAPTGERGTGSARPERRAEYAETWYPRTAFFHSDLLAMRTPRWKYVRAPRPELYDLVRDPQERTNLYAELPDTAALFELRLQRYVATLPPPPAEAEALPPEQLERLRSLGYLSGEAALGGVEGELPDPKDMLLYMDGFIAAREDLRAKRWEDAEGRLRIVLEHNPKNIIAARQLAEALRRLRRPREAMDVAGAALAHAPTNASLARVLALSCLEADRPDAAYEAFSIVALDDRQHWSGVIGMAMARVQEERFEEALEILEREAAARPQEAGMARGGTAAIRRYAELIEQFRANPNNERIRLDLASFAFDLGMFQASREWLQFRSDDSHTEGSRLRLLGSLAGREEDYATALVEFEAARQHLPGDAYIARHLAPLYLEHGRPREALAAARAAIRIGPAAAADFYNEGCALAILGDADGALRSLEAAVRRGYSDGRKMLEDPDLASLRDDPRLGELAQRAARSSPAGVPGPG